MNFDQSNAELRQNLLVLPLSHMERPVYYLNVLLRNGRGVELCFSGGNIHNQDSWKAHLILPAPIFETLWPTLIVPPRCAHSVRTLSPPTQYGERVLDLDPFIVLNCTKYWQCGLHCSHAGHFRRQGFNVLFIATASIDRGSAGEPHAGGLYAAKVPFRGLKESVPNLDASRQVSAFFVDSMYDYSFIPLGVKQ